MLDDHVALYWDFENLHAALCEEKEPGSYAKPDNRFRLQEPLVDVQAIVELAASYGPIAINRAYCNWQFFGRYRDALLQNAVELQQLFPPGGAAKNGADIRLCLDAVEDVARFPHLATVVIVGGDSDFMPVSHKIKTAGRALVGVGTRKATNRHWAKSCTAFRYYESLLEEVTAKPIPALDPGADLFRRALRLLAETKGEAWVDQGEIQRMIRRLDPTFRASFPALIEALGESIELRSGANDQQIRLR
jgi:uncharacterized LabA/DUF88 family protein